MCGNAPSMATPFVINASVRQTATVIFLHGLGDTGAGWCSAFHEIRRADIKYIFPNAPTSPVTLNGGLEMPSWFDIISLSIDGPEDKAGINKSTELVRSLVRTELDSGLPSNRIILGGFSQGGAVALNTALLHESKLAGIIGLSCWLPNRDSFPAAIKANQEIPIFQGHGDSDPLVNIRFGLITNQFLSSFNPNAKFVSYPGMMHSSCQEELVDVQKFIDQALPKP